MQPTYYFDHVHVVTKDPKATADFYQRMFDAKVIESAPDGKPRIDVELNGLTIFLLKEAPGENLPSGPAGRYRGLDHFGLRVDNLDASCAELKRRGAEFTAEPLTVRPGLKIAFMRGPENSRIEILERS